MSPRPCLLPLSLCLGLGLGGCSFVDSGAIDEVLDGDRSGAALQVAGKTEIGVLPSGIVGLTVRYVDVENRPVPGVSVEFAVVDAAGDSLMPAEPVTDQQGLASTVLRAGSSAGRSFRVRAWADGVDPVFVTVHVRGALEATASVTVEYNGLRQVTSRTVTAVADTSCEQALLAGVVGEQNYSSYEPSPKFSFPLGPGLRYAIMAWGRDDTNAKVAQGCQQVDAPITADDDQARTPVAVELVDLPMELEGTYVMPLDLNVSASAERMAKAVRSGAESALPSTQEPEADLYLDALEAQLRAENDDAAADKLAQKRTEETLDQTLAARLAKADVGPLAYVDALAARLKDQGSRLEIRASYSVGATSNLPMSISTDMLRARSMDGERSIELSALGGYLAPVSSIEATYNDARAVLDVSTLSITLGLGSYGKTLLLSFEQDGLPGDPETGGCGVLAEFVKHEPVQGCDASCARTACERGLSALSVAARDGLAALDSDHANIGLRGEVYVHDRGDDGVVDDIGPATLEGNWGKSPAEADADTVQGVVPKPMPAKLAL